MAKFFIATGGFGAFLGVGFGAFGAHALRDRLSEQMLAVWQTGVLYQLIHALGLILIGVLIHLYSGIGSLKLAGWLLVSGIILFSGSLYLLALFEIRQFGMITPIGGLAFLVGWLVLVIGMIKQ